MTNPTNRQTTDTFWSKMDRKGQEECWNWNGGMFWDGYGRVRYHLKMYRAHRLAYILVNGEIPHGMVVMHTCDNRRCCNPTHLQLGTQADNLRDADSKGRRHGSHSVATCPHCGKSFDYGFKK